MVDQPFADELAPVGFFDARFPEHFDEWQHRVSRISGSTLAMLAGTTSSETRV